MVRTPIHPAPQAVSSGHFLYCKTDLPAGRLNLKKPESEYRPNFETAFPQLAVGEAFMDAVRTHMSEVPTFSVLGLRLLKRPIPGVLRPPKSPGAIHALVEKIQAAASIQEGTGLLGVIDKDTLGWAIRHIDSANAFETASLFMAGLPDSLSGRLVVGIAPFPCLDYAKTDTLQNARKAVDHAFILGAAGIVVFDALTLNVSGDQRFEADDIAGAMIEYERGLRLDPGNENLHNSLGVCYGIQGDQEKAMACFEKTLAINPSEIMAIYNTGYLHQLGGRQDLAIAAFLKAGNLDPLLFEAAFQAGQTYLAMGLAESAEPFLERAATLKPQSNPAQRLLGECRVLLGKHAAAETAFREAIRISPQDAESLSMLGRLYERENRNLDIAAVFHRQSISITPENGRYHLRLARALLKLGQFNEALAEYGKAESLGQSAEELLAEILENTQGPEGNIPLRN